MKKKSKDKLFHVIDEEKLAGISDSAKDFVDNLLVMLPGNCMIFY